MIVRILDRVRLNAHLTAYRIDIPSDCELHVNDELLDEASNRFIVDGFPYVNYKPPEEKDRMRKIHIFISLKSYEGKEVQGEIFRKTD